MFILRIPFEIQGGAEIKDLDKEINHSGIQFKLKKETHRYALIISGFNSEDDANLYFSKAWSGLNWVLLNCGIAPIFKIDIKNAKVSSDPRQTGINIAKSFNLPTQEKVHGIFDAADTIVFDGRKNYKTISGGKVNLVYGASSERFMKFLIDGVESSNALNAFENDKIRVAFDMYAAFYSESSGNAKFLSLIMALESLAKQKPKPESIVNLIVQFQELLTEKENSYLPESEERFALSALKREIDFRKGDSIRSQVRALVSETLCENGDEDYDEVSRRAVKIYDARSELVHNGKLKSENIGKLTKEIRSIVERVLKAKLMNAKPEYVS